MKELSEEFWSQRYTDKKTGWDIGDVSTPIKEYIDQLNDKTLRILIPGCGHGYEAEYLHLQGFNNVHILDISAEPLKAFQRRVVDFPREHIHKADFFSHTAEYDLLIEQTMFCALAPSLRKEYAEKVNSLLAPGGKLVGLLFDFPLESGPPFGGDREEYLDYFSPFFSEVLMERCHNSITPRKGNELFIKLSKV